MILAELAIVVFLCNLMPIMAPPTWSVLVYFVITHNIHAYEAVIVGAIAAASGRYLLALLTGKAGRFLPAKVRDNLFDAGLVLESHREKKWATIALFIISPLPSAQLFEAAGLMRINLFKLTLAFFSGRIITYSIYASGASSLKSTSLGETLREAFTSPYSWILQLISIGLLVLIAKIDWKRLLIR